MSGQELPDFAAMTPAERVAWVEANADKLMMLPGWQPGGATTPAVDSRPTKVVSVRLAVDDVEYIDQLTAGHVDGRSGFVREWVEKGVRQARADELALDAADRHQVHRDAA